jgi:hypothetical protein
LPCSRSPYSNSIAVKAEPAALARQNASTATARRFTGSNIFRAQDISGGKQKLGSERLEK